jgi:uncharacterized membrane protein YcjF (UPF0283 family)
MAEADYTNNGTVDIKGNPANKKKTGNWKSCRFILGMIFCPSFLGQAHCMISDLRFPCNIHTLKLFIVKILIISLQGMNAVKGWHTTG